MSNVAEGFESATNKEFTAFLDYARRSCGEVRSQLYAALDDGHLDSPGFMEISEQATKTGRLITGFISYLRGHAKDN